MNAMELTRYPLSAYERAMSVSSELDLTSPLGIALFSEPWLNWEDHARQYWLHRLNAGVIGCITNVSALRGQVEVVIEMHPGETAYFCVTLARMDRFY